MSERQELATRLQASEVSTSGYGCYRCGDSGYFRNNCMYSNYVVCNLCGNNGYGCVIRF